jgi:hypothetical protein
MGICSSVEISTSLTEDLAREASEFESKREFGDDEKHDLDSLSGG